jgi:hypothetical protein
MTRFLLFLIIVKELYNYKRAILKFINESIFNINRRDILNLYFKAILIKIKRVLIIFRIKK